MKIISWNVNGIKAIYRKNFAEILKKENVDIFCIQETKADPADLSENMKNPKNYQSCWNTGSRKGYSGVGVYFKEKPLEIITEFKNIPEFSEEGRVIQLNYEKFILLNIYFPNGGTRADGTEMLSYKLRFYDLFLNYIKKLAEKKSVIICGDYNIAHKEIDIARPKENENSIGFLPEERVKLDKLIQAGFIDAFRLKNPDLKDAYTWWSYRTRARERNVGWRLDYFFISKNLKGKIKNIRQRTDIFGSDHCPVELEIEL